MSWGEVPRAKIGHSCGTYRPLLRQLSMLRLHSVRQATMLDEPRWKKSRMNANRTVVQARGKARWHLNSSVLQIRFGRSATARASIKQPRVKRRPVPGLFRALFLEVPIDQQQVLPLPCRQPTCTPPVLLASWRPSALTRNRLPIDWLREALDPGWVIHHRLR